MMDFVSPDPVALHAGLRPAALACRDLTSGKSWTYRQLDQDIQRAISVLQARNVQEGDRVATVARNTVDQIILQQALMRMGAIFVPLNWRLSPPELAKLIADCTPVMVYVDEILPELPRGCPQMLLAEFAISVGAAAIAPRARPHSGMETCIILYTSGTSGVPKGTLLTSQFLLATAVNFSILGEVDTGCVFLCDSPMFHVIGIVTQIWPPLLIGGSFVVSPGFEAELTNQRLGDPDLAVTHYFCVPQMADALRHAPNFRPSEWASLKALFTGGAPNPPANIRWWLDQGVKMVDGYGMTETGTTIGMPLAPELLREKAGSVGLCGPVTAIKLVDENDNEVPEGEAGEILVFGLNVTPGYWNRPEERATSFTQDGWIRTGDIARRDEDGFIYIIDRRKDMFISGGENVYPVEVEAALREHPAIREVAVIGLPDARWGEVGRAYVVLAPDAEVSAEELATHCIKLIARYKVPKDFIFVEDFPRTGSGKIMKHVLRKQALELIETA